MNNWIGLILCFIYIFAIIGLAESLRKWRGYSSDFTRKVIHIGVGMMSWALHFFFDNPLFFAAGGTIFMVITFLDWRLGFFKAMATDDQSNLGTVYFPLAAVGVVLVFWDQPPLMVASLMPLTWGDGLAPIVGKRYGRHPYSVHTSRRTIEGSAGFFLAAFLSSWLALWLVSGSPDLSPATALLPAFIISLVTTGVEAVSIWGLDNMTITAGAALILSFWPFT